MGVITTPPHQVKQPAPVEPTPTPPTLAPRAPASSDGLRKASALIFAFCGFMLLATWHRSDSWYWIWERGSVNFGTYSVPITRFSLGDMSTLDFALKIAGLAFIAVALFIWPPRRAN